MQYLDMYVGGCQKAVVSNKPTSGSNVQVSMFALHKFCVTNEITMNSEKKSTTTDIVKWQNILNLCIF